MRERERVGGRVKEIAVLGLKPVAAGLAFGIAASCWATALRSTQLFGVSPLDPFVYAAVVAGVLIVGAAAALVPVGRALRVRPLVALTSE